MKSPAEVCALIKCTGTKRIFQMNISELPEKYFPVCCFELNMCRALYESLLNWLNLNGFQRGRMLIRAVLFQSAHFTGIKRTSLFLPGPLPCLTFHFQNCYLKVAHNLTCNAMTLCFFSHKIKSENKLRQYSFMLWKILAFDNRLFLYCELWNKGNGAAEKLWNSCLIGFGEKSWCAGWPVFVTTHDLLLYY